MSKAVIKTPAMTTLNGVFNQVTKVNHRRNFLRENKLSLRELQRVSSNSKQTAEQTPFSKYTKQQLQQTTQPSQSQHSLLERRSSSLHRQSKQQQSQSKEKLHPHRSNSQQRNNLTSKSSQQLNGLNDFDYRSAGGGDGVGRTPIYDIRQQPSQRSTISITSKAKWCDKEIQTEDIKDEEFLYDALKKCTVKEIESQQQIQDEVNDNARHADVASNEHYSNNVTDVQENYYPDQQNTKNVENEQIERQQGGINSSTPSIARSHYSKRSCADDVASIVSRRNVYKSKGMQNSENDCVNQRENEHANEQDSDDDQQLSARSIVTVRSVNSNVGSILSKKTSGGSIYKQTSGSLHNNKETNEIVHKSSAGSMHKKSNTSLYKEPTDSIHKSSNGSIHRFEAQKQSSGSIQKCATGRVVHQLGSRDDIRLPRYLEREKREKEEQRMVNSSRDPNCPYGHFVLSEEERVQALNGARTRFQDLVSELNRMPMTSETLRMRSRKVEIERELATIEADIRTFSKPKVYVKHQ